MRKCENDNVILEVTAAALRLENVRNATMSKTYNLNLNSDDTIPKVANM